MAQYAPAAGNAAGAMKEGPMKRYIFLVMVVLLAFWNGAASAFWGSESTETASGLNVSAGFDVNTITTMTGTVQTPPVRQGEEDQATMSVKTSQGAVTVVLGPWWYWEKQNLTFTINQDLGMTGSLAQGKDGGLYLFAQRLENRSNGETLTLRSETGRPFWSRNGTGAQNGIRQNHGSGSHSGAGNHGSGMRGGRR